MTVVDDQTVALVALLRAGGRAWASYILSVRRAGSAQAVDAQLVLEEQLGLLAYEAQASAAREVAEWRQRGYRLLAMSDPDYPPNLRVAEARPPLLFVSGELRPEDGRSVAVIGTRRPSAAGRELARLLAERLAAVGITTVSGLAAGIDTEAHRAALGSAGRTVAVIGTGLDHVYPPENRELHALIAQAGAVVSQFWPESQASRQSFPARNAVMAGITLASVIVEAGPTSGTRVQARHALSQGRSVILMEPVLVNEWARALAQQPGVSVASHLDDAVKLLRR